mgnify:CR=1 FL=1
MDRLHPIPGIRQAVAIVSGRCSRAEGWAEARHGERSEPRPDCPPFPERGVGGRGAVAVVEAVAVAVRGVQDPALCERNGEALHSRQAQAVYSGMGGSL